VHLTETCATDEAHLVIHVETTEATMHEAQKTAAIDQALVEKGLPPGEHFVDSASIDAKLLVESNQQYDIALIGPTRPNNSWQARTEGAYDLDQFSIDWDQQQVRCPQGKLATTWQPGMDSAGEPIIYARFHPTDCQACPARACCTRAVSRRIGFRPREQYEALEARRRWQVSAEGQQQYHRRAGIEGTLSQGMRAFGLRLCRYRGLAKTKLQHIATAAAMNIDRLVAWFDEQPQAQTRTSRFARLAPA
jgi:transposase